ncbi:hypothetical protein ACET3Z_012713 [Daucus carota]
MFLRRIRPTLAAVRHFSGESAAASIQKPPINPPPPPAAVKSGGGDTIGRRLLSLVYTKRSAVTTVRKWKEEGHVIRKYELNRNVRLLRKLRRYKHALEICEWMKTQEDMQLVEGDYAVHLDLISKVRGLNSAEKFFEDLPEQMRGQLACSSLLHNYVKNKDSSKAEALMEKMLECGFTKNPLPYNHMISLYISNGQVEEALRMIKKLKKNTSPDLLTYNLWLRICASLDDIDIAENVFLELKKANVEPDWVTYSTLTNMYINHSCLEKAAASLKEMEKKTSRKVRTAYVSIISLHTRLGNKAEIRRIWKKMKSTYPKLNDEEYTNMISSQLKLEEFEEAHKLFNEWESVSPTKDCRIANLFVAAYINKNQIEMAEDFYKQMVKKGITPSCSTWELLTWGYLKQNDLEKALISFQKAVASVKKWEFNEKLVRELYRIIQAHKNIERAEQLLVILRHGSELNTAIYNELLKTYANAGQMPLVISERMKKDKVELDDETRELVKLTSKMCVGDVSSYLS